MNNLQLSVLLSTMDNFMIFEDAMLGVARQV